MGFGAAAAFSAAWALAIKKDMTNFQQILGLPTLQALHHRINRALNNRLSRLA